VNNSQFSAALLSLKTTVDAIASRLKKDTTPPTTPVIKATGGIKLVNVALTTPSTDAGGL